MCRPGQAVSDLDMVAAKVAAEVEAEAKEPAKAPEKPAKAAKVVEEAEDDGADEADPVVADKPPKAETDARAKGWKPKDEWEGDPEDWVNAKQFLKKGEEIEERQNLKKSLKQLSAENKELAAIVRASLTAQNQEKVAAKLAQRDAAIEVGDKAQVYKIEQELSQTNTAPAPAPAEVQEFISENREWWGVDPQMMDVAIRHYGRLEAEDPSALKENLKKTQDYMRRRFPSMFPQDRKDAVEAAVEMQQTRRLSQVAISAPGGPKKSGWSDLPPEAKRVGEKFVRDGVMTREQYIESFNSRKG